MADPLQELLRSPLDDLPQRGAGSSGTLVVVIGLVIGLITGWIVGAPTAPADTSQPVEAEPTVLEIPVGYVEIGLGYAVAPTLMYTRGDDLVMVITVASRAGDDSVDTGHTDLGIEERGVGIWTVELTGGRSLDNTKELFDDAAPGVITLEFEGAGVTTDDVLGLSVRTTTGTGTRTHQMTEGLGSLPARLGPLDPLAVTERVESTATGTTVSDLTWLSIDQLTVDWGNAAVAWSMEPSPDVRVLVRTGISVEGDTADPIRLETHADGAAFLQRLRPPLSPASSGEAVLRKVGGAARGSFTPSEAVITFTVSWLRYGEESVEIPLDDVARLDPIG